MYHKTVIPGQIYSVRAGLFRLSFLPDGFNKTGHPTSISFIGGLYNEGKALEVAKAYKDATDFNKKHPSMFE